MTTNNHILAAKLLRLATELDTIQAAVAQMVTTNKDVSLRILNRSLKYVSASFRILASHLKPKSKR